MFFQTHKGSLQVFRYCSIFKVLCASAVRLTTCLFYHRSGFLSSLIFLEAFELSELGVLQTSQCQLVFSASIGSFQGLRTGLSEVVLFAQRLALKYNTTPRGTCQHFLTSFLKENCVCFTYIVLSPLFPIQKGRPCTAQTALGLYIITYIISV